MKPYLKRAWAEVSMSQLKRNVEIIKKLNSSATEIMAVVKADAYGHGDEYICKYLYNECQIKYFAVSNLDEAIAVRNFCPESEILILGYTSPEYAHEISQYNIIQGVVSTEYARKLAYNTTVPIRCHIKIDTGMGRIGLKHDTPESCADEIENIMKTEKLSVEGIYTHFAVADSKTPDNIEYTDKQEKFICDTYDILASHGIKLKHMHFMNSAATCYRNNPKSTLSRAGIIMYGLHPDVSLEIPESIEPVMSVKAVISHVKTIENGDCVSYGRTFTADREMKIATVTVGYADGYSRLLSSKGEILVHGKRCKIIGRVCMDQLMIDVSNVDTQAGDIVTLIGTDSNDRITADELASLYGTIGYEVVCGISKRVPRIYKY
ncbi:MAG: alanine racemase [Prevotella sp.]|nr:alanine racemase [Alistipes senegalensis]MCM1357824.1 alanine racemase [Prevotella sp.]MCM1474309.1 alanine racemase [Muribaculaceae bacterium]